MTFKCGRFLVYFKEFKFISVGFFKTLLGVFTILDERILQKIPIFWLAHNINQVLVERKNKKIQRKDYVNILLETLSEDIDSKKDKANPNATQMLLDKKMTLNVSGDFI